MPRRWGCGRRAVRSLCAHSSWMVASATSAVRHAPGFAIPAELNHRVVACSNLLSTRRLKHHVGADFCFSNEEEAVPKGNTSNFITFNRAVRSALDDVGGAVAAVKLVGTDFCARHAC